MRWRLVSLLLGNLTLARIAEFEDRWDLLDVNSVKELVDDPKVTFPRADLYQTENVKNEVVKEI